MIKMNDQQASELIKILKEIAHTLSWMLVWAFCIAVGSCQTL